MSVVSEIQALFFCCITVPHSTFTLSKNLLNFCWLLLLSMRLILTTVLYTLFTILRGSPVLHIRTPWFPTDCRLQINEVKIDTQFRNQFIELRKVCTKYPRSWPATTVHDFSLVFLDGKSNQILLTCHLKGHTHHAAGKPGAERQEQLYVVGTNALQHASLRVHDADHCESLLPDKDELPYGDDGPIAVLLLHMKGKGKDYLSPNNEEGLSDDVIKNLQRDLHDFVVYSRKAAPQKCSVFSKIFPALEKFPTSAYLRHYLGEHEEEEKSLSACDNDVPTTNFNMKFFTSEPSAGETNKCNNIYKFDFESSLPFVTQLKGNELLLSKVRKTPQQQEEEEQQHCEFVKFNPQVMKHLNPERFKKAVEDAEKVAVVLPTKPQEVQVPINRPPQPQTTKKVWDNCDYFNRDWEREISSELKSFIDIKDILKPQVCFWIEYIMPTKQIKCKICESFLSKNKVNVHDGSTLLQEAGMNFRGMLLKPAGNSHRNAKTYNKNIIDTHLKNPIHKIAQDYFTGVDKNLQEGELDTYIHREGSPFHEFYLATTNLFRVVYGAISMKLPFNQFKTLANLVSSLEGNIGSSFRYTNGIKRISQFISDEMKKELTKFFLEKKPKVALTIDGSVDASGEDSLSVVLKSVDSNLVTRTHFYGFLPISDSSGENLFKVVKNQFKNDGLLDFMKSSIIGYTSDGAPNVKNRFKTELTKWINEGKPKEQHSFLIATWCSAHSINLGIKWAFKPYKYIVQMDNTFSRLFRFFSPKNFKNLHFLKTYTQEIESRPFTLKRLFSLRWISNKSRVLETILKNYGTIASTLKNMLTNKDFKKEAQIEAKALLESISDTSFVTHLIFLRNVISLFSRVSKQFQEKERSLIGKREIIQGLLNDIHALGYTNIGYDSNLLQRLKCKAGPCSVLLVEQAVNDDDVKLDGISIKNFASESPPKLSVERTRYVESIKDEINTYFEPNAQDNFDIFYPKNLPSLQNINTYGLSDLLALNGLFKWTTNTEKLKTDFTALIRSIVQTTEFQAEQQQKVHVFWMHYRKKQGIMWTPLLLQIVQTLMTSPCSSADCERYFSYYNLIKSYNRYLLKSQTVDMLVRIRYETGADPKKFNALFYAWKWAKTHYRADEIAVDPDANTPNPSEDPFATPYNSPLFEDE